MDRYQPKSLDIKQFKPQRANNTSFNYDTSQITVGGIEQLKYFDRLNRAANRQQNLADIYSNQILQHEKKSRAYQKAKLNEQIYESQTKNE